MSKTFNIDDSNVSVQKNKITVDLSGSGDALTSGTDYEVIVSSGAVTDQFGNNVSSPEFKFKTSGTAPEPVSTGGTGGTGRTDELGETGGSGGTGEEPGAGE